MSTTILAIDLGKFNSVLCWYEPTTKNTTFRTIRTSAVELRKELTRQAVAQIVFEACSRTGWVQHDLCVELQLKPLVASTTGAAWQWKRVRYPAGVELADLTDRSVGTEMFLGRCGHPRQLPRPAGVAARTRNAVWRRSGPEARCSGDTVGRTDSNNSGAREQSEVVHRDGLNKRNASSRSGEVDGVVTFIRVGGAIMRFGRGHPAR